MSGYVRSRNPPLEQSKSAHQGVEEGIATQAAAVAPVVWLLGKVQAGKTSIVRALTGESRAAIGDGLRACTRTAQVYDFPPAAPLVRFLDTRGLGEASYDPGEDLAFAETAAHCTIVVMRAMDRQQERIVDVLARIRRRRPDWPILLVHTHLHEGYAPGAGHVVPYSFGIWRKGIDDEPAFPHAPPDLAASLAHQRRLVGALAGHGRVAAVAVDLTKSGDGLDPPDYGVEALQEALEWVAPSALASTLADLARGRNAGGRASNHALILGHAAAASAADLVPVAAVAAVPAVQGRLLQLLARRYEVAWTRRASMEFAGALGAGFLARYAAGFGIRQLVKLIPAYGQTAGAAAAAATSFATTYALGKAAEYYLDKRRRGATDTAGVQEAWSRALREALTLARRRGLDSGDGARSAP